MLVCVTVGASHREGKNDKMTGGWNRNGVVPLGHLTSLRLAV
jgi:hypothetical protein